MRGPAFTLGLENDSRFTYKQAHLVTQLDRAVDALDAFQPEIIVNFAALCEVGQSWTHAINYYETNLMSLVRLTNELAQRSWFKKFVQIGSSEIYGSVQAPATEAHIINPSSPYAASKAAFDFHLKAIAKHQGFNAVIVMPSNGYGEGQTLNRIIPKTIIAALTGHKIQLQGGGMARKSYLHADDISKAITMVMEHGDIGETYNCGPVDSISIRTLVGMLASALGKRVGEVCEVAPERVGQDSQYLLDSRKIEALGWHARIGLELGLARVIEWIQDYPELLMMDHGYTHRP